MKIRTVNKYHYDLANTFPKKRSYFFSFLFTPIQPLKHVYTTIGHFGKYGKWHNVL